MKKILYSTVIALVSLSLFTECITEELPTAYATSDQVAKSATALEAIANGTASYMFANNYFSVLTAQEFGYPAIMIMRDAMTDCPVVSTTYNQFNTYWCSLTDFTSARMRQPWRYFYALANNANNTLASVKNPDEATAEIQALYANALIYRVMAYMDIMRMYEYKKTGVAKLDGEADKNKVWGLTGVIIDENFDAANAPNNQRAPFYTMYRFILTDLDKAEKYLEFHSRRDKTRADLSVVHAFKARLWLEIATRFQKHPADLQTQIEDENHEELADYSKLGIASANDCYAKASEYAGKVIGKYSPLTQEQWHSKTQGFNEMSFASWVFAISIGSVDAAPDRVNSFQANTCTEFLRGYCRSQYHAYRMIDRALYDKIGNGDWRKVTWIDPADFGKKPTPAKYHTLLDETEWALRDAYVGFKFRPGEGNDGVADYRVALAADIPLIRVEEMYFIDAEAKAYTHGLGAGTQALVDFMNTHRYTDGSYSVSASDVDDLIDNHIVAQKRIELWGEGLAYFDIKRRELAITRGYTGTNWLEVNRINSLPGFTPSWLNLYVPYESEGALNKALVLNPDPAVIPSYGRWTAQ